MKKFLLPLYIAFAFNAFSQNQRLHVRANAAGANDGSSWQDAFPDLQSALALAQAGDSVWVAEGTYYPTSATDRTISFRPKSGVRLFGGFAGSETSLSERDWEAHPVVLSGAIGSIFSVDNSLHILFLESPDSNTVVDGLRFTKGVEDADTTNIGGAAIYVWAKDTLGTPVSAARIRNCRFYDNTSVGYGGAVTVSSYGADHTRFENCTFEQNSARFGGAVGISAAEVQTVFAACRFISNVALEGGGAVTVGSWASGVRFSGCLFEKNRTKDSGGGAVQHGGSSLPGKGVAFDDCLFLENVCEVNNYPEGGAIHMTSWGGADTLTIAHCTFKKNSGAKAGGIYVDMSGAAGTHFRFSECRFEENGGLAVRLDCSGGCGDNFIGSFEMQQCDILQNNGEAVSIQGSAPASQETRVRIDSCRFMDNQNGRVFTLNIEGDARLDIARSIFRGNKDGEVLVALASQIFLTNCIIEENKQAYWLFSWEDGTMQLRNCLFRKNQTQDFLFGVNFGALNAINCHFDGNMPGDDYPFPFFEAEATVANSVFTNNTGAPYVIPGYLNPHFHHCYFAAPLSNPPATLTLGPGILTGIDPMFENPATANFHLQPCSPLVGAGSNAAVANLTTDLDGQARVRGGTVDIGVFERAAPSLAASPMIVPSCPGDATGSVMLQATDGCAPYAISWSSGAISGQNGSGLTAGDYVFSITDSRGSVLSLPLTIPEKPTPVLTPFVTPVDCNEETGGNATLTANGAAPFVFLWPDGVTDTARVNLAAGTYPVTITDAGGCAGVDSVTIGKRGRLKASVAIDKISCPGFADGNLSVTPQNGLAPFHWLWETGDTTASLMNLGPGLYRLTLTDALGCESVWMIPLVEPDEDCFGDGSVVFPNPFSDQLNIRTEFAPDASALWVLTDALGRVVESIVPEKTSVTLNLPALPAGIYFWQMRKAGRLTGSGVVEKR